jgi:peptide/nickel transport system ATP-binding protein
MARRVLLAMATAGGARLILADEPTVGLDATNARSVLAHLRTLADEGRTVVVVSHDVRALARLCDRIAVLHAGATVGVEDAAAFADDGRRLRSPHAQRLWRALPGAVPTVRVA